MEDQKSVCLYCGENEHSVPLISFRFGGAGYWICPQHLPLLIHQPRKLAGVLPGIERVAGSKHEDHGQH